MAEPTLWPQPGRTEAHGPRDVWPVARGGAATAGPSGAGAAVLRRFGLEMAAAFSLLGGVLLWKGRAAGPYLLAAAAAFALAAVLAPRVLAPGERGWMALARLLGTAMTYVVLTVTWVILLTPIGLLLRLLGKDLLALRRRRERATWWVPVEPKGPCSRPDKPF